FAKAEEIDVSDDDLAEEIDRVVGSFGVEDAEEGEPNQLRQLYQTNEYLRDALVDRLTNQKITDRLIELTTDGRGALLGEAAEAYEALMNPPEVETEVFGLDLPTDDSDVLGDEGGAGVTQVAEAIDVDDNESGEDDDESSETPSETSSNVEQS
ncbi:MAG TPA: hypothetical protein VKU87_00940, partial [Thermomicrobiaceae bacterium]|nr:hypothetical protein [Thermomicrobiaceae bacterium]